MTTTTQLNLNCISYNLGWARDAHAGLHLPSDVCPGRAARDNAASPELAMAFAACEQACCRLRGAFNRRNLSDLRSAAMQRRDCLARLGALLPHSAHG